MTFTILVNEVTCADKVVIASILCTLTDPLAAGCLAAWLKATGNYYWQFFPKFHKLQCKIRITELHLLKHPPLTLYLDSTHCRKFPIVCNKEYHDEDTF